MESHPMKIRSTSLSTHARLILNFFWSIVCNYVNAIYEDFIVGALMNCGIYTFLFCFVNKPIERR